MSVSLWYVLVTFPALLRMRGAVALELFVRRAPRRLILPFACPTQVSAVAGNVQCYSQQLWTIRDLQAGAV